MATGSSSGAKTSPSSSTSTTSTALTSSSSSGTKDDNSLNNQDRLQRCVPVAWTRSINALLVAACTAVVLATLRELTLVKGSDDPDVRREKLRIVGAAVSTLGVLAWPVVWDVLVGYSVVAHHPLTFFGFVWPIFMNLIDLVYASRANNTKASDKVFGIGQVSADAATVVGIAFAIATLLTSQANKPLANATVPLIMYALLLLIAFVVPTPSLDPDSYVGFAVGSIQRTFFNYAMGLVVTGIAINISGQPGSGLQRALRGICGRIAGQDDKPREGRIA